MLRALVIPLALSVAALAAAESPPPPASGSARQEQTADLAAALLEETAELDPSDPAEGFNRGMFIFNGLLDRVFWGPASKVYGLLVPDRGRRAIRRAFDNLASPAVLVNDLLQLEPGRASVTGARFLMNTTFGIGGLLDPASDVGLEDHHSDFGQTLWRYGADSGPYLVLPLFGPSSARDGLGQVVDLALRVDLWILGVGWIVVGLSDGISVRDRNREAIEEFERGSVDPYAAVRSAYWMDRTAQLETGPGRYFGECEESATEPLRVGE